MVPNPKAFVSWTAVGWTCLDFGPFSHIFGGAGARERVANFLRLVRVGSTWKSAFAKAMEDKVGSFERFWGLNFCHRGTETAEGTQASECKALGHGRPLRSRPLFGMADQ